MKKALILAIMILGAIFILVGCANDSTSKEAIDLDGIGLNDLVEVTLPDSFEEGGETISSGPGTEVIGICFNDESNDAYLYISMLSYKGEGVLGSDNISAEEYFTDQKTDTVTVDGHSLYIGYTDGEYENKTISDISIDAYVSYENHELGISLVNESKGITPEQKEEFYEIIKSIKFK